MGNEINPSNYIKALKAQPMKSIVLSVSSHKQAIIDQDNKCIQCKKVLRPYLYKFVISPITKKVEVICADCSVPIKHR